MNGLITTPLESEIASANGIDYLESTSVQGLSSISAHLKLNYAPNGAVVISGIVALTPMMCSRLLSQEAGNNRFARWLDRRFDALSNGYQRRQHSSLDYRPVTYTFALAVLAGCYFIYTGAQAELAPTEDQGIIVVSSKAAPTASLNQIELWTRELTNHFQAFEATAQYFLLNGGGLPVQFVIGATDEPRRIYDIARELQLRADRSGRFLFTDLDLEYNRPQVEIHIDRDMAAALGPTIYMLLAKDHARAHEAAAARHSA